MSFSDIRRGSYFNYESWMIYLQELERKFFLWHSFKQADKSEGLKDVNELMKKQFPGNYKVVEKYNPNRRVFHLELDFENPKEEMIWKIRWS